MPAVMKSESTGYIQSLTQKPDKVSQIRRTNERILLIRSKQVAQLSERDRAAGWVSFCQK